MLHSVPLPQPRPINGSAAKKKNGIDGIFSFVVYDYYRLNALQNRLVKDASEKGHHPNSVNLAQCLHEAAARRSRDVRAYQEVLAARGLSQFKSALSTEPLVPRGDTPQLERDPLLELIRFKYNPRAASYFPKTSGPSGKEPITFLPFASLQNIQTAWSFPVVNWDEVWWLPGSWMPEIREHRVTALDALATTLYGAADGDISDLERLAKENGYASKWWSRRGRGFSNFIGLPAASYYPLKYVNTFSLNDVVDPFALITRTGFVGSAWYPSNSQHLVAHTNKKKLHLPIFVPWSQRTFPHGSMRGPSLLSDLVCEVPFEATEKLATIATVYNIEQLRRPLPPDIVANVKHHYATEEARLAALVASGSEDAYSSPIPIEYTRGKSSKVATPSSSPPEKVLKTVCINGVTGESLFDIAPTLRDSHYTTKVFFKAEDLVTLGLKIFPNAVPLNVPILLTSWQYMAAENFTDMARALCNSSVCVVHKTSDPNEEERIYQRVRKRHSFRSKITTAGSASLGSAAATGYENGVPVTVPECVAKPSASEHFGSSANSSPVRHLKSHLKKMRQTRYDFFSQ